mmetsp:Transcript_6636/g.23492  ORF Transcript_6636/g.23492 Transcript_6636/m.23492 type:complete len:297 (-) Transcript_6636:393-1283(-)
MILHEERDDGGDRGGHAHGECEHWPAVVFQTRLRDVVALYVEVEERLARVDLVRVAAAAAILVRRLDEVARRPDSHLDVVRKELGPVVCREPKGEESDELAVGARAEAAERNLDKEEVVGDGFIFFVRRVRDAFPQNRELGEQFLFAVLCQRREGADARHLVLDDAVLDDVAHGVVEHGPSERRRMVRRRLGCRRLIPDVVALRRNVVEDGDVNRVAECGAHKLFVLLAVLVQHRRVPDDRRRHVRARASAKDLHVFHLVGLRLRAQRAGEEERPGREAQLAFQEHGHAQRVRLAC